MVGFFVPILYLNLVKMKRFGRNIAYTLSKSMKKSEIWSKYKGVFGIAKIKFRQIFVFSAILHYLCAL